MLITPVAGSRPATIGLGPPTAPRPLAALYRGDLVLVYLESHCSCAGCGALLGFFAEFVEWPSFATGNG
ncbi:MAG: hypothetical protein U5N53_12840 [Mycobacterium sp.]|nr:hypothetical protein [Mycobacterium sp.]